VDIKKEKWISFFVGNQKEEMKIEIFASF